ncbi:glycosyl transferase family 64 domain-containing protein [Sarocladium implicatum]|nr:glycosyl transferase family 64 domain-containing protein [Sarocladium implicatum]
MRLFKRTGFIAAALLIALVLLILFRSSSSGSAYKLNDFRQGTAPPQGHKQPKLPACVNDNSTYADTWTSLKEKHANLLDDKFTIVVSTFHRPKELKRTLDTLTSIKVPSLHEIVVVWNNFDDETPATYKTEHGVRVRYRKPTRDSLNEKLWPDPTYETQGILLSDDDVYYRPHDLEFVFQSWRKFGQERMTGALSRCTKLNSDGTWVYDFCALTGEEPYSLVLTNLAFTHIGFLDYYFSDESVISKIRKSVDKKFNCEDIALNFVSSVLTGTGPLLVRGQDQYVNVNPSVGISQQNGHLEERSGCINDFAEAYGCMPLMDEEARIERGHRHNRWYKTLWDRLLN